jgi:hypothetical protein
METLRGEVEIIEYKCRIVDGSHNNIMRRDSILHQVNYDLMTVASDAAIEINRIARDCMETLRQVG